MFISTGGTEIDKNRPTALLMHGSGLSHIVWSLHEQFTLLKGLMFYQLIYLDMEIQMDQV